MNTRTVGVVLKGYPRLSETFIAQEIAALERTGFELQLISLRHPTDKTRHPIHDTIAAPVRYLPEYLYQEPRRVLAAWRAVRSWPSYGAVRALWLRDLARDRSPNRIRRFGQALVLAHELRGTITWLYAHFLHTPASVARYAAALLEIPWSVSAHAKDVWTTPEWEKREKLESCSWLVTCTRVNAEHLSALAPDAERVALAYHGLDFDRFPESEAPVAERQGETPLILSVGRAVEKKGYDHLLKALAALPRERDWRFRHIGGGGLSSELAALANSLGIGDRVEWCGAQPQPVVLDALRKADMFVLASRITESGDRDGLPNVLMEACSQAVPCIASRVSAIPELIEHEVTGLLTEPEDVAGLSAALERLLDDPAYRHALGRAGALKVRTDFTMDGGLAVISERLREGLER